MKLPTLKLSRQPAVSVDALCAATGGTVDEVLDRCPEVGRDFMDRPMISAEDAKAFYDLALRRQNDNVMLPIRFEAHQEERQRRRREVGEAATERARAAFVGPHRGGEETQRWMQAQWTAERAALEEFDAANPEITITQFREKEKAGL